MSEADKIIENLKKSGRKVKEFYTGNKTSDKNVANIEDDVKIVKEFIDYAQEVIDDMEYERPVDVTVYQKDLTSMKNILAEREQMLKEREKYTIRLTDEEYRKVIENAQMDTSNDKVIAHKFAVMQQQINEKDKRIKELEEENAKYKSLDYMFKIQNEENYVDMKKIYFEWLDSIPKQIVIDKIEENKGYLEYADIMYEYTQKDVIEECIKTLQELLGGEK